jgi:hypothetical protein
MKRHLILLTVLLCLSVADLYAQVLDSLLIQVGTTGTVARKNYQPLWITSQRFGTLTDRKSDLSTHIGFSNVHMLGTGDTKNFYIRYGADLYNNNRFDDVFLQQAYLKAGYKKLELRVGRYEEVIGEIDKDLSSGSLGVSGNALPIPQIGIALTDYVDVPYTNGWLQVKGQISHGWMGEEQFIKDAWLHQKTFYLRAGKRKLKVGAGIQHYAIWGGNGKGLPTIKKNFWDVFIAREANDGTVGNGDLPNRSGDHRGVIEGTIDWDNDRTGLHLYMQMPFETGQGIDIRNIDRLLGLAYTNKTEGAWLQKVVGEFIYTKQMNDFYNKQYRESYYNNGIYLTGWEYQSRIIGTPLFVNRTRGAEYFPGQVKPFDWNAPWDSVRGRGWNIINNRVVGGHLGFLYTIRQQLFAKTMITFTQNYGNENQSIFSPSRYQFYTLQEIGYQLPSIPLSIRAGIAVDWGELSDNAGLMLGVNWQFRRWPKE